MSDRWGRATDPESFWENFLEAMTLPFVWWINPEEYFYGPKEER